MIMDAIFNGFRLHYFNQKLKINVVRDNPVFNPRIDEVLSIISKFTHDDCLFLYRDNDTRIVVQASTECFFVEFCSCWHASKECNFNELVTYLHDYENILEQPELYGFIIES